MGRVYLGFLLLLTALVACSSPSGNESGADGNSGDVGQVSLELQKVPAGVQCVVVTVNGVNGLAQTTQFTVAASQSPVTLNLSVLPAGALTVLGSAYNVACSAVTSSVTPTWYSYPATTTLVVGQVNPVQLYFREYLPTVATTNFVPSFSKVAMGPSNTAVVTSDGDVAIWGSLTAGLSKRMGLTTVKDVAIAYGSACAIKADGSIWCWGDNSYGQLGNGTTTSSTTPVKVTLSTPVAHIVAGYFHFCAITAAELGAISTFCWGYNGDGELGDHTFVSRSTPVSISTGGQQIVAGGYHTCSLGNEVHCWGWNGYGQLGNSANFTSSPDPTTGLDAHVVLQLPAVKITTGAYHSCAVLLDGSMYCWGNSNSGQLGSGTVISSSFTPIKVPGLSNVSAIGAGVDFTCAISDTLRCWGGNGNGELGSGSGTGLNLPVPILPGPSTTPAALTTSNGAQLCMTNWNGAPLMCWGDNSSGQLDTSGLARFKPTIESNW